MYNKKGALELSINTIVIVVIGITILSLGLIFVKNMFSQLEETQTGVFSGAQKAISEMQSGQGKLNMPASLNIKKNGKVVLVATVCNVDGNLGNGASKTATLKYTTGLQAGVTATVADFSANNLPQGSCTTDNIVINADSAAVIGSTGTIKGQVEGTVASSAGIYDTATTIITVV